MVSFVIKQHGLWINLLNFQAVRTKYASSKFMKISSCSELKGQVVKELASQNDLWTSRRGFNQQAVICVLSWWLKWNCCGAVDEICVWSPQWWINLNVSLCVAPYGVLCMRISLFISYQDLLSETPFYIRSFFYFLRPISFYHYLEAYKFSWYLETFFSFQLLISAFEIFAVKRSLYFIMLDCSIDCNHSSINLLREHEWMMYERIVNSEIMILMFTKQGITFIFHMTSFFSFFLFYTWPSFPFSCFVNRKMQKKKKKSNCRCWIVKSWWNLLEYFYSVFQLR